MSDNSTIEWTNTTWNPLRGCARVSEGCRNCYAEAVAARFSGPGLPYEGLTTAKGRWTGEVRLVPEKLAEPLRWRKPRMVFVNSMSDLFHDDVPNEYIAAVFGVMAAARQHAFQVLTKRPERMRAWFELVADQALELEALIGETPPAGGGAASVCTMFASQMMANDTRLNPGFRAPWPLPNVWLGVSVENQAAADKRIPLLLQCPAAVRWVSAEPLLGPVDFSFNTDTCHCGEHVNHGWDGGHLGVPIVSSYLIEGIDWVVVGGESGRSARPCDVSWVRGVVEQCAGAGVPVFVKQLGAVPLDRNDRGFDADHHRYVNDDGSDGGPVSGPSAWPEPVDIESTDAYQGAPARIVLRDPKGGNPDEWPEDLRVREFPGGAP